MTIKLLPSYISITTNVPEKGCSVYCKKYCPQELIAKHYKGERYMSVDSLQRFLLGVNPKTTALYFGGFTEPLANPQTVDMMEWAHQEGYQVLLFSTFAGFDPRLMERLVKIPFALFVWHLPDPEGIAHIPLNEEYWQNFKGAIKGIKRRKFMDMSEMNFETNHREDIARELEVYGKIVSIKPHTSKRGCVFLDYPRYELMPNGEMYFCCETSCLTMRVGSLYENTYRELEALHPKLAKQYREDRNSLCYYCCQSEPYWKRTIREGFGKMKERTTGGVPLKEMPVLKGIYGRIFT